jgi:CheY-like chemotaxis protein
LRHSQHPVLKDARPDARSADLPSSDSTAFINVAGDDREAITPGDRVLLIVENDLAFAKVLLDAARHSGFKGLVSTTGAGALSMTRDYHPMLITLDIHLPDMQGWRILDRLKNDPETSHIPICVVSTDDARERALQAGAVSFLGKPLQSRDVVDATLEHLHQFVERPLKTLLLLMPPSLTRTEFVNALDAEVEVLIADKPEAARQALEAADCVVVDESFMVIDPQDVRDAMEQKPGFRQLPVVFFGEAQDAVWQRQHNGFGWRQAGSIDALMAHTAFFLHRSPSSLSDAERRAIQTVRGARSVLAGKKALIVDDDMRNIFALATVLDDEGMVIVSADNGREAIRLVESDPEIDIVLMDIMMPEMDGIATMQEIRKLPRGKDLPMVAVTAKAMKGDRQKCIEAGAWDYLSKPVDPPHLLAVLRGWLCL